MKNLTSIYSLATVCLASLLLWSCGRAEGDFTGSEYMPDMAHSIAYEANHNLYYNNNTWDGEEAYRVYAGPRRPVKGTVARGYMPSNYQNLEDYRTSADESHLALQEKVRTKMMTDSEIKNPVLPTSKDPKEAKEELEQILASGAALYTTNCAVCHGDELDGNGVLYNGGEGKYSAKPANFTNDVFYKEGNSDGRFLNAILHGKGQMQPHADKMNPTERWNVIHYIRSIQATKKGETYNPGINTNTAPDAAMSVGSSLDLLLEEKKKGAKAADLKFQLNNVLYNVASSEIKATSYQTLDALGSWLIAHEGIHIEIDGHTDNDGKPAKNLKLSEERAHSVYNYLVEHGVDASQLAYKGYGDTQPVASNDSAEGKKQNRRTEVKIIE